MQTKIIFQYLSTLLEWGFQMISAVEQGGLHQDHGAFDCWRRQVQVDPPWKSLGMGRLLPMKLLLGESTSNQLWLGGYHPGKPPGDSQTAIWSKGCYQAHFAWSVAMKLYEPLWNYHGTLNFTGFGTLFSCTWEKYTCSVHYCQIRQCPISFWLNHIFPYVHHFFPMSGDFCWPNQAQASPLRTSGVANAKQPITSKITKSPEIQKHQLTSTQKSPNGGWTGNHLWILWMWEMAIINQPTNQGRTPGSRPGQSVPSALAVRLKVQKQGEFLGIWTDCWFGTWIFDFSIFFLGMEWNVIIPTVTCHTHSMIFRGSYTTNQWIVELFLTVELSSSWGNFKNDIELNIRWIELLKICWPSN